ERKGRGTMMRNWTWKLIVGASFVAAAILLFLAAQAGAASAPAIQSPAPGKPRIGGTLKFGIVKDIGTPIPFVAYTSIGQYVKDNVFEPLVMFDPEGRHSPLVGG